MLGPSVLSILLVFGLLYGTVLFVRRRPRSWMARLMLSEIGPTEDVAAGTPRAMRRRARWFILASVVCFGTDALVWKVGVHWTPLDPLSNPSLGVLFFTFSVLGLMGVGGALYIGWRTWRGDQDPFSATGDDRPRSKRLDA